MTRSMSSYASDKFTSFKIRHPEHLAILEHNGFTWNEVFVGCEREGFATFIRRVWERCRGIYFGN
jgi:hypothetical protein